MRLLQITGLLILFSLNATAQQHVIDSLEKVLPKLPKDTSKVWALNELAFKYASIDIAKAKAYADQGSQLADEINWKTGQAYLLYTRGVIKYYSGAHQEALLLAHRSLQLCKEEQMADKTVSVLNFLTSIHTVMNELDSALYYANESLKVSEEEQLLDHIGTAYFNIGQLQNRIGNEALSKTYQLKALPYFEKEKDTMSMAVIYQSLALVSNEEEAMEYNLKAMDFFKRLGNIQGQAFVHAGLANVYYEKGDKELALEHYEQALDIYQQLGLKRGIASVQSNLGLFYTELGRFDQALPLLESSRTIANNLNVTDVMLTSYRGLISYYAYRQRPDSTAVFLDSLLALQDTLYSREKADALSQAEAKFQVKEQAAAAAAAINRQKRLRRYILFGALALILILALLILYLRSRQRIQKREAELALQLERTEAEKLKELDTLKSNFFANISHEFRTPLTLILGLIRKSVEKGTESSRRDSSAIISIPEKEVKVLERNALRLQNLVNQLLDLSKLDSGRMELKVAAGDLIRFVRQVVFSFESLAERKGIQFDTQFPEEMQNACFDADKIEKILANLLSNAFKFTPEGGRVAVEASHTDEQLILKIGDSGPGMKPDEARYIFDRFYQVEGTQDQGTGIGLSLVHELVELYRGQIEVDSQEGAGTTFTVRLPYKKSAFSLTEFSQAQTSKGLTAEVVTAVALEADTEQVYENSGKDSDLVLVVEDNYDLRNFIADTMRERYRVIEAEDGKKGLEIAIAETPDLIVSDVLMPKMNGFELSESLKKDKRTSHIPIILLTAKAGQSHKLEGLETGADDYLTKPFDQRELLLRVRNLIARSQQLREKYAGEMALRPAEVNVTSVDEQFLDQVSQSIEKNLSNEQFSVEDLAAAVAFSRSQLHRKLKALTGKSPNEHIRNFRLLRAKELLEKGAGNVSEVAIEVGYNSLSYFTSSFKKAFGLPPSEIAKKNN